MSHFHPLPSPAKLSRIGRVLAAAQAVKETLTILFLGLPLVKAVPLVLLAAVPGIVLYLLHWYMAFGKPERRLAATVWVFTLVDEILGLLLFKQLEAPTHGQVRLLHWSYFLGLGLILTALLEIGWRWRKARRKALRKQSKPALPAQP